jgi:tRNA A-37 threonylcarbamoyl transferase component Bud32
MVYQVTFKEIHERNVCHGDVRPENILVKPDNFVVIVDFEWSVIDAEEGLLAEEMEEVERILGSQGHEHVNCFLLIYNYRSMPT